jgi:hypothetical protein
MTQSESNLEAVIVAELRHHLAGWRAKIVNDFSQANFESELASLKGDPLYPKFNFDTPDYVMIRFMGRVSISIGRRLGEIYDKISRRLAVERYGITHQQVAPKFGGLELDVGLRFSDLQAYDADYVKQICRKYIFEEIACDGIGIEIRYNFNPNDSSRLRKDCDMAAKLVQAGLRPIYLVFSSISPRDEAISRLERAGWKFLVGQNALDFSTELLGVDLAEIWDRPLIKSEIQKEVNGMMSDIKASFSFSQVFQNNLINK